LRHFARQEKSGDLPVWQDKVKRRAFNSRLFSLRLTAVAGDYNPIALPLYLLSPIDIKRPLPTPQVVH
jgi:hypothetical protein